MLHKWFTIMVIIVHNWSQVVSLIDLLILFLPCQSHPWPHTAFPEMCYTLLSLCILVDAILIGWPDFSLLIYPLNSLITRGVSPSLVHLLESFLRDYHLSSLKQSAKKECGILDKIMRTHVKFLVESRTLFIS